MLNVHRIIPRTKVEGPGTRFCIWVQGCHNYCEGCFARDTWDPDLGTRIEPSDIVARIRAEKDHIEGVTFLGGEPMEQARALAEIAKAAREMDLGVLTFTGRTYEELLARGDPAVLELLSLTDLLIDGPFRKSQLDYSRPLVGSKNQRYLFLTDRYCEAEILALKNGFEVRIDENGQVRFNGMGDLQKLKAFVKKVY